MPGLFFTEGLVSASDNLRYKILIHYISLVPNTTSPMSLQPAIYNSDIILIISDQMEGKQRDATELLNYTYYY